MPGKVEYRQRKNDTLDCEALQCQREEKCRVRTKEALGPIPAGRRVPKDVRMTWNC